MNANVGRSATMRTSVKGPGALAAVILFSCAQAFLGCGSRVVDEEILHLGIGDGVSRNHGITEGTGRVRVAVDSCRATTYLQLENPHVNRIRLHDGKGRVIAEAGDALPFAQRPVDSRYFVLPLPPRAESDTLLLQLDKAGENLSYTLTLLDAEGLQSYLVDDGMILGFILGVYGIAILLALIQSYYRRSLKFHFFLAYLVLSLAWILNDAGILYRLLWPENPQWHTYSRGFFSSVSMGMFALYIGRNTNRMLTMGLRKIVLLLLLLLGFKFAHSIFLHGVVYSERVKYAMFHVNAAILLTVALYVLVYLLTRMREHGEDAYEILAIQTYCLFVSLLSLRELGVTLFDTRLPHHMEVVAFFPLQCLFMVAHLYRKEKERRDKVDRAMVAYRLEQQRTLDGKVREAEEREKKRIARNIHDEIGSIFAALKYQILSIQQKPANRTGRKELDGLLKLAEEGIQRQYSIIDDLLFEIKSDNSLEERLRQFSGRFVNREDISTDIAFEADESEWSGFLKSQLFRILSELLTNTIRHAAADTIRLRISQDGPIRMEYHDNGHGFDTSAVEEGRGIGNIRERVKSLNGLLKLHSDEKGTHYLIEIPPHNE